MQFNSTLAPSPSFNVTHSGPIHFTNTSVTQHGPVHQRAFNSSHTGPVKSQSGLGRMRPAQKSSGFLGFISDYWRKVCGHATPPAGGKALGVSKICQFREGLTEGVAQLGKVLLRIQQNPKQSQHLKETEHLKSHYEKYLKIHAEKSYRDLQRAELQRLDVIVVHIPESPNKEALRKQLPILFTDKTSDKTFRQGPAIQHTVKEVPKPTSEKPSQKEDALQAAAQSAQEQADKIPKLSEPSETVYSENLGFRYKVRECVKKLSQPLDTLSKNPLDPHALKEIEELASQYRFELKRHTREGLYKYQHKQFKALESIFEAIVSAAPQAVSETLRQCLPILCKENKEQKNEEGAIPLKAEATSGEAKKEAEKETAQKESVEEPLQAAIAPKVEQTAGSIEETNTAQKRDWPSSPPAEQLTKLVPPDAIKALRKTSQKRIALKQISSSTSRKRATQAGQFPSPFVFSGLNGQDGVIFNGEFPNGRFGAAFAVVDANFDGNLDIVITDPWAAPGGNPFVGAAYLFLGPFNSSISQYYAADLNGPNGCKFYGIASTDYFGWTIVAVKNFRGTGRDGFAISAKLAFSGKGGTWLFDAKPNWPAIFYLANFTQADGTQFFGPTAENLGTALAAGDILKIGRDVLLMGAPLATPSSLTQAGKFYLIPPQNCSSPFNLSNLTWPIGAIADGLDAGGQLGYSLGIVDYNNDTIPDILAGVPYGGTGSNVAFALAGNTSGYSSQIDLSKLNGPNGTRFYRSVSIYSSGLSVGGFGKFTVGGFDVIAVGAPLDSTNFGSASFIEGEAGGLPAAVDLSNPGNVSVTDVKGTSAISGIALTAKPAGDVNGDGKPDGVLSVQISTSDIVCAVSYNPLTNLSTLDGSNGFLGQGPTNAGVFAGSAGDLNQDGIADVGCGTPGQLFVVYGTNKTLPPPPSSISPISSTVSSAPTGVAPSTPVTPVTPIPPATTPIPTLSPSSSSSGPVSGGGTIGEYIGIALAALVALAALIGGLIFYFRRKKNAEKKSDIEQGPKHQPPVRTKTIQDHDDLGVAASEDLPMNPPPKPDAYMVSTVVPPADGGEQPKKYFSNEETFADV